VAARLRGRSHFGVAKARRGHGFAACAPAAQSKAEQLAVDGVSQVDGPTDRDLVARCQAGEEAAFNALVQRHQQRALNVAYQILRDHEDAIEVALDAFVSVYRHIGEFRGDSEFTTWLHMIVVNLARNKHRWWKRRGRAAAVPLDAPVETEDGEVPREQAVDVTTPAMSAAQAELVRSIDRAMRHLPQPFREVLVLRNVEELGYDEIAGVLRCSVGTVKSRLARAREALRAQLRAEQ
jgi:RNA polymerase sigma-70 factor (ECF subfamily)